MTSSAACHARRPRGVMTADEDGPTSRAARSFTEANSITCHCHCPSSRSCGADEMDDSAASAAPATTVCDLCERLRGQTGGRRYDSADATWTGDSRAADRSSWRKRDKNDSLASAARANGGKRERTSRCDRTPLRESSARCASSVVRWILAVRHHGDFKSTVWRRLLWIVLLVLAVPDLAAAHDTAIGPNKDGVCQSIDIRNNVNQFSKLKGCRVVEGFVQILLIDRADLDSYTNVSFPDLVEITGYLILYRVSGLKTIGHVFPNLTVIRGHSLFINYAFVVFEMMHLQEIGLPTLTNILRGSVRIEKNPTLCYVDTIDWDIIAKAGKGGHFIKDNKPTNGCPVCDKKCPARHTKPDQTLCWNQQHCQKICARKCEDKSCNTTGDCCHPLCLGGCTGPTANDCVVCRNVVDDRECKERCPKYTYEFMNRRCIEELECRQMMKPREAPDTVKMRPYRPFNDSCVMECPAGYMESEERMGPATCRKCEGQWCLKECPAASVDSIASAQKLRGCTHIAGSLEIQIRGGKNIVKELEDSLSMIEEIDGYLKIVRSFPLISLNFLKNLRVIRGNQLENSKYSLAVLDNQNLQELWDWNTHTNITILSKRGGSAKLFFHFNPKLCLHEIEKLREKAKLEEFTDHDVASSSNGDKVACNVTELKTKVLKKSSRGAIIEWKAFTHHDTRSLLGYVVYFIEAPNQNITMYDGRDACGGDGWRVEDVSTEGSPHNDTELQEPVYHTHILTLLKPYTQYAYYVKTYTIATERSGAQSKVKYFTTLPDAPSSPRALTTWSNSSNELVISWFPPLHKNGNLTHYRIVGRWEPDDPNFIDQRNYCDEPMLLPEAKPPEEIISEEEKKQSELEKQMSKSDDCTCNERETTDQQSTREKEVSSSIAFENALHNQVYVKRISTSRRRRHTSEMLFAADLAKDSTYDQDRESANDKVENGTFIVFERLVPSTNLTFVMRNLRHFAAYNIEVQACREPIANETKTDNCSTKSMKTYRTLMMDSADNIPPDTFKLKYSGENNSLTVITLSWEEPPQPNGLIVTYQIEYKRVDIKNIKATVVCITRRDFANMGNSYVLKELSTGNYSVKVRATSLAGNGAYTEVKYFYIPEYGTFNKFWIFFWSILGIIIMFSSLAIFYIFKKRSMRNVPSMRLIATVNPEYVSTSYVPDEWEVPRKKIQLLRELGNGSFGMVYEGLAKDVVKGKPEVRCAVKTVNENATDRERIEFLNEASVMKAFNTHHVVRLLGVVSQGQPTLVVMELMVNGDLKTYLRSHRPDVCESSKQPPTLRDILQMAVEIADGMSYLAAKKFVHRDLAARNCMVAEDLTVKIGDFGMTRDIYETDYYRKGSKGLLPVRWMAPESLKDGVFTSFSDVWSYGVVLWEMVTLASQPYQGLSNDQVLRYVIEGGVMERPENCPDSLYNLMRRTWNHRATRRPTFIDIETLLLQEVSIENFENVSFYHSPEGIEARNQNNSHSSQNDQDLEMVALQDLREEEMEGEEDSPLRQDFGDFASFEPRSIKNNLSPRYEADSYGETSKAISNFHDMNSTKVPKAGFDEFGGISGDSLVSSKDTLNSPFVEGSLKSVRSSPFIYKKSTSRSNVSQGSLGKPGSPQSLVKRNFLDSPNPSKFRDDPDYENKSPEIMSGIEKKEITSFPSKGVKSIQINGDKTENMHTEDYMNKSETLNNGFIGNTAT